MLSSVAVNFPPWAGSVMWLWALILESCLFLHPSRNFISCHIFITNSFSASTIKISFLCLQLITLTDIDTDSGNHIRKQNLGQIESIWN